MLGLLLVLLFTALFALVAKRMAMTVVTAPMVFLALGFVLSKTGLFPEDGAAHVLHLSAEITLLVLLFLDAAQIDLSNLRKHHVWPVRMLLFGLPIAIALGFLTALLFLPTWPIAGVALLAALLAPTDAALGQAVVANPLVPLRSRQTLTVESGLNDGLALPLILLFTSLAAHSTQNSDPNWLLFAAKQLVLGPLVGVLVGVIGGKLMVIAQEHELTSETFEGVGALCLAAVAYLGATLIGGNGFISAFAAGLGFGYAVRGRCRFVYEFIESEGQFLTWGTFFLVGLALLPDAVAGLTPTYVGIIAVSLFVVRPLAIWISLIGTDAPPITRLFFGWFGPRGLATVLFALLVVPQVSPTLANSILIIAVNAVWISALLHGLSAVPGSKWYAKQLNRDTVPEPSVDND